MKDTPITVTVLPGDGIGQEVTPICLELIEKSCVKAGAPRLQFTTFEAGAAHYQQTGISLPEEALNHAKDSDATLLACMGLPSIRYPDGREIAPQLELREKLDLFAGVRPVKTMPALPLPLADARAASLDFVLVRESTEGLFASREAFTVKGEGSAAVAYDTQAISRRGCERVFHFAFELGRKRKAFGYPGIVTCIDKANVLGSFYFMRSVFDDVAKYYPDIEANHIYVDAAALQLVRQPWQFDVLVTENMFGDILSDLGAGLMGGMGMAPSADIGHNAAVFQPCHGSAPDIIGEGKANPTAMYLSAAMMLEWLGQEHDNSALLNASNFLNSAINKAYSTGKLLPIEFGGKDGTTSIHANICRALDAL